MVVGCCCCSPDSDSELATASMCSAAGSTRGAPVGRRNRGHVSGASESLERMRFKNRGGLKGKHCPYAHEAKANNSLHSINQTRAYNRSNYRKSARTTIWGKTTTDMVVY